MHIETIEASYKDKIIRILDAGWPEAVTIKELDRAARLKYEKICNIQYQRRQRRLTTHLIL